MVNRRILRVKTLQALYGCEKAVEATYNLGLQHFDEVFNPILFDEPDRELLKSQKEEGKKLFSKKVAGEKAEDASDELVLKEVSNSFESYEKGVKLEKQRYSKNLASELDALYGTFLSLFGLLIDLSRISDDFKRQNFGQNKVIDALKQSPKVQQGIDSSTIKWTQYYDQVRGWFRDVINKDASFQDYESLANPDFDADKQIVLHIIKKVVFKNELIQDFLEEQDLYWSENKSIVKSLATKTIKDLSESEEILLRPISYNWEEDQQFFEELYSKTLELEEELEPLVADNSRNWEYERIASIDKIILRMALTEMIIFPSIPIKVTINEYLEIAKLYSTPKSKQFINGVLDITAKQLVDKGEIKKSGRGLIDNK